MKLQTKQLRRIIKEAKKLEPADVESLAEDVVEKLVYGEIKFGEEKELYEFLQQNGFSRSNIEEFSKDFARACAREMRTLLNYYGR